MVSTRIGSIRIASAFRGGPIRWLILGGALLIAAMLIIPAATARSLARTPEAMAVLAIATGALSGLGGLALSLWEDTPTGPSIIVVAATLFALSTAWRRA